ncbi:hypothetical protein CAI21_17035 [Alkalilimnicola ehrlichii]|uniref:Uncharacterized protein n=1 Tax=Alkalilimnicola ehrlichii TaxID=351052 RepID=A0A3E0WNC7_9GAMM|nr:hypothetical protein CAI21_17035 [Alkalilimnicola ehrlichii]RFA33455.1 hypothetical protein CAL65_17520 [Alkalilimnicola ehrlichii]
MFCFIALHVEMPTYPALLLSAVRCCWVRWNPPGLFNWLRTDAGPLLANASLSMSYVQGAVGAYNNDVFHT